MRKICFGLTCLLAWALQCTASAIYAPVEELGYGVNRIADGGGIGFEDYVPTTNGLPGAVSSVIAKTEYAPNMRDILSYTGYSVFSDGSTEGFYTLLGGSIQAIPELSTALGVNEAGDLVGTIQISPGVSHAAILYAGTTVPIDLNAITINLGGFTLEHARDINSRGQIVVGYANGLRGALLNPCSSSGCPSDAITLSPEPATWALSGLALAIGAAWWRRQRVQLN